MPFKRIIVVSIIKWIHTHDSMFQQVKALLQ